MLNARPSTTPNKAECESVSPKKDMRRQIIKQPIGPVRAAVARPANKALVKKSSSMIMPFMIMMVVIVMMLMMMMVVIMMIEC